MQRGGCLMGVLLVSTISKKIFALQSGFSIQIVPNIEFHVLLDGEYVVVAFLPFVRISGPPIYGTWRKMRKIRF